MPLYLKYLQTEDIIGRNIIPLSASAWQRKGISGAALSTISLTTADMVLDTYNFDSSVSEAIQCGIKMPKQWNASTISFNVDWTHLSGTSYGVVWGLKARAISDNEPLDGNWGTEQISVDTGGVSGRLYISPESSQITCGGSSVSKLDTLLLELSRLPSNENDTLDADANLINVNLFINTDSLNDL